MEERHDGQREDDHRDRQAEVELDEPQAGRVRLARRAHQRHGAHLRCHHRQADRPPRQRPVGEKVAFDLVGSLRAPQPVDDDPDDVDDEHTPVERMHQENIFPKSHSSRMMTASTTTTRMYVAFSGLSSDSGGESAMSFVGSWVRGNDA